MEVLLVLVNSMNSPPLPLYIHSVMLTAGLAQAWLETTKVMAAPMVRVSARIAVLVCMLFFIFIFLPFFLFD